MTQPVSKPWAILLCKFSDDPNDPTVTRVKDLAAQWRATKGSAFAMANLNPSWDTDNRTLLELYQTFFTITGIFTLNVVQYFDAMSHGLIDVTGNQVFPITLDLTAAQGAALAANPGGKQYQNAMFKRAKTILKQQYGVDSTAFLGGVAISFQSPDFGSQGSTNYDGGPGVFADIRWVRNNGTQRWGHEMGHGFGLQHSRTDGQFTSPCTGGDPSDYTDPWDIMSITCAFSAADASYGFDGPGMNAWNMRFMGGLDESRVWKASAGSSSTQTITLSPLHRRNRLGYLAAEMPGMSGDSAYLVEFRVPTLWDAAIGQPVVLVHRFDGAYSYLMKGTSGQKSLAVGDVFEKGNGPRSRVKLVAIDAINETATIQLCYLAGQVAQPAVKVAFVPNSGGSTCTPKTPVESTASRFTRNVQNLQCSSIVKTLWSVSGASALSGQANDGPSFSIVTPSPTQSVTVSVMVVLDDGVVLNDSYSFHPIAEGVAAWIEFFCKLDRLEPIPWWEWDPEKLRDVASQYSRPQLAVMEQRAAALLRTIQRLQREQE